MTELEELQKKLFKAVKEMRRLQSLYWDTKAFTLIDKVKKQEKYVDRLIDEIIEEEVIQADKLKEASKGTIFCRYCSETPSNCKCE